MIKQWGAEAEEKEKAHAESNDPVTESQWV